MRPADYETNLGGTTGTVSRPIGGREFCFQEIAMNQLFLWIAVFLCLVYGALTAFAGLGQVRAQKIQAWATWGMVLFGLMVITSAVLILLDSGFAFWVLLIGLVGIHAITINNGYKLFGKVNLSHHVVRLIVSLLLLGLAYLGMK
jgi:hypothetical protein